MGGWRGGGHVWHATGLQLWQICQIKKSCRKQRAGKEILTSRATARSSMLPSQSAPGPKRVSLWVFLSFFFFLASYKKDPLDEVFCESTKLIGVSSPLPPPNKFCRNGANIELGGNKRHCVVSRERERERDFFLSLFHSPQEQQSQTHSPHSCILHGRVVQKIQKAGSPFDAKRLIWMWFPVSVWNVYHKSALPDDVRPVCLFWKWSWQSD